MQNWLELLFKAKLRKQKHNWKESEKRCGDKERKRKEEEIHQRLYCGAEQADRWPNCVVCWSVSPGNTNPHGLIKREKSQTNKQITEENEREWKHNITFCLIKNCSYSTGEKKMTDQRSLNSVCAACRCTLMYAEVPISAIVLIKWAMKGCKCDSLETEQILQQQTSVSLMRHSHLSRWRVCEWEARLSHDSATGVQLLPKFLNFLWLNKNMLQLMAKGTLLSCFILGTWNIFQHFFSHYLHLHTLKNWNI